MPSQAVLAATSIIVLLSTALKKLRVPLLVLMQVAKLFSDAPEVHFFLLPPGDGSYYQESPAR